MYYAFIVNPAAGTGFSLSVMQKLEETLSAENIEYRVFRTERPGHATQIAAELASESDIAAVVSVGGDGTAGEVAAGLTGTGKTMGIIPAGTGNDFIKSAGIPMDPSEALKLIFGERQPVFPQTLRANFYKCADKTKRPHFVSWRPIDLPKPDFHCPQFFGEITLL